MRAEYAADINRRYSTFVNAPAEMQHDQGRERPTGTVGEYPEFAEAMMRDRRPPSGDILHYYTRAAVRNGSGAGQRHRLRRGAVGQ